MFRLREVTTQSDHTPTQEERERLRKYPHVSSTPKCDFVGSGRLQIELSRIEGWGLECTIKDTKKKRVEDQLNQLVVSLLQSIDHSRRLAAERAREELERQEREQRRLDEETRRREEAARVQSVIDEAESWHRARRLREYLDAVRSHALEKYGAIAEGSELDKWLSWGSTIADRMDPLTLVPIRDGEIPQTTSGCSSAPAQVEV
jgi:hypothetical protein